MFFCPHHLWASELRSFFETAFLHFIQTSTGRSFSEALILALTNPQYDKRLFMELPWKLQAQNMGRTCSVHVLFMLFACSFHSNSMNNLLSYCGLVDARISASEKDLPVQLFLLKHNGFLAMDQANKGRFYEKPRFAFK